MLLWSREEGSTLSNRSTSCMRERTTLQSDNSRVGNRLVLLHHNACTRESGACCCSLVRVCVACDKPALYLVSGAFPQTAQPLVTPVTGRYTRQSRILTWSKPWMASFIGVCVRVRVCVA